MRGFCAGDPYGTRTHVTAVKGRCLNHLTNGPGSGNLTRTDDTPGMNRMLYQLSYAAIFCSLPKQQSNYIGRNPACQGLFFKSVIFSFRCAEKSKSKEGASYKKRLPFSPPQSIRNRMLCGRKTGNSGNRAAHAHGSASAGMRIPERMLEYSQRYQFSPFLRSLMGLGESAPAVLRNRRR